MMMESENEYVNDSKYESENLRDTELTKLQQESLENIRRITSQNNETAELIQKLKASENKLKEVLVKLTESDSKKKYLTKQIESMSKKLRLVFVLVITEMSYFTVAKK